MASVEAASALLTAQSLVLAALAVVIQKHDLFISDIDSPYKHMTGLLVTLLVAISFLGSISYLHVAEYPTGFVASFASPKTIFNITTLTFLGFVHIALVVANIISLKQFKDGIDE